MLDALCYIVEKYLPTRIERFAERKIKKHRQLWDYLQHYKKKSPSTGCSFSDYLVLYKYVKQHKPKEVLECGTGFSTVVIMQALKENEKEFGIKGRLVSMEENEYYYKAALDSLPLDLKNDSRLEIRLSPAIEDTFEFFRGVRYKDVPKRAYEFVYVDGPDLTLAPNKTRTFNCDFMKLVSESERPIGALIDTRKRTCLIYSLFFGRKFHYDYLRYIGVVEPVTRHDLADGKKIATWLTESHAFSWPSLSALVRGQY